MSRPSGPVVVFQAHSWSATVTVAPPGHVCASAGAGPVPDAGSGRHGTVLPLPSPPTIVTGPHVPSGLVPGEPVSPDSDFFAPSTPLCENTHAPTVLAPSAWHEVGTPDVPWVRIVPEMFWSP